jgi:LysR family transcriptional regulator, transcription activator of glutamate synthase operon
LASYTLPSTISAFREHYPQVKFQLIQGFYNELIEGGISGDFDIALIGPVPKQENKVLGTTLFTDNIVALLPANHPLAEQSAFNC